MVTLVFDPDFRKKFDKIRDRTLKDKIAAQIIKLRENPEIGKPMRYGRKGTREIYISPFRLSYSIQIDTIYILDLYHKDEQ
jgi:mRNA-degrading endonuclease RelE of RelBE toxin-antitoxin system